MQAAKDSGVPVGIIIPTLGSNLESLRSAIKSAMELPANLEVVIVTKTQSPELIQLANSNLVTLIFEPNLGLYQALNRGIQHIESSCEYFSFLGDDDLLDPTGYMKLYFHAGRRNADIIYGGIRYVDEKGELLFNNFSFPFAVKLLNWAPNLIPNPGTIVSVSAWRRVGGYDEDFKLASDLDFWIRVKKFASFKYVKTIAASFRFAGNSLTYSQRFKSIQESSHIRKKYIPRYALFLFRVWDPFQVHIGEYLLARKLKGK